MKRILLLFIITSQIFSQNLQKEPVAIPAPFKLQQNIVLDNVTQSLAKTSSQGDTTFYIRENVKDSDINLESVDFYKSFENDTLVVYSESDEYDNGNITDETVSKIVNALLYETPTGSLNPHKGILTNELELLGETPDVDKNGKLFVLLIDVRDNYEAGETSTYVAGYFDPLDQMKSKGNYSDIIYIDTNPANTTDDYTLAVVAHELQHLIHYNYDTNESTWLNEGLSELAPLLVGYTSHSFAGFLNNTNNKLASFEGTLNDYSKVGLWSFYIYKRFGIEAIQQVLKNKDNDISSYVESLSSLGYNITSSQLLRDWFLANLLNDESIEEGQYSYFGEDIPVIQSDFYHSNFTEGEVIYGNVKPQAAQYIQFNSGKNINLSLDIDQNSLASLAVVKYTEPPTIKVADISSGSYDMEDLNFGSDYTKLSLVLSWTSALAASNELDFSYSAVGIGGYEENELYHDEDTLNYYISLSEDNVAAEKFSIDKDSELSTIKFNCGSSSPVDIKIYSSLERNPIATYSEVTSNYQDWTVYNLDEVIEIDSSAEFYISLQAAGTETISMGYAATGNSDGNSFLKSGTSFYTLDNFSLEGDGTSLDGNWLIRAVVRSEIFKEAEMVLEPDTLIFTSEETEQNISITNSGTEMLYWSINDLPDYLIADQDEGVMTEGSTEISISAQLDTLQPGVYYDHLVIDSNVQQDSITVISIKYNDENPQAGYILSSDNLDSGFVSMKVFNIGNGESEFSISDYPEFMAVNPASGTIQAGDTIHVNLKIDQEMVNTSNFTFSFNNTQYTSIQTLKYGGTLASQIDEGLKIYNTYPNPFVLSKYSNVNILVRLKKEKKARIKIFNVRGQLVNEIPVTGTSKGLHLCTWAGQTSHGIYAPSGVYILRLEQSGNMKTKKLLLIK